MGSTILYKPLVFGMSSEKQESFLKMSILTTAAILCQYNLNYFCFKCFYNLMLQNIFSFCNKTLFSTSI